MGPCATTSARRSRSSTRATVARPSRSPATRAGCRPLPALAQRLARQRDPVARRADARDDAEELGAAAGGPEVARRHRAVDEQRREVGRALDEAVARGADGG